MFHEYAMKIGEDPNIVQRVPLRILPPSEEVFDRCALESAFKENHHKQCYKFLYLPYFMADLHSRETQDLQNQYMHQRQDVNERYSHSNFLEVTLKRFCLNR